MSVAHHGHWAAPPEAPYWLGPARRPPYPSGAPSLVGAYHSCDMRRDPPARTMPPISSRARTGGAAPEGTPWLLLIHQIPPKPDYFRVKVGRRLQRIGAVPIKNSVYVLPATEQAVEDFQWVLREIIEGGGEASLCRAEFVDGVTDREVEGLFREARSQEYEDLTADARALLKALPAGRRVSAERRAEVDDAL